MKSFILISYLLFGLLFSNAPSFSKDTVIDDLKSLGKSIDHSESEYLKSDKQD